MKQSRRPKMSSGEVVFWVLCLLAAPAAGQVRVSTIQEAIERWSPATHVYVLGDVGMEPAALSELESSLAGGHWTILLVQDATGQIFQDDDGVTREGADAIEWGTGQGMARAAGFADQVHPKTGEPDGTILSIVMAQRALCYTASKAQDDRGIGDAAFAGNLDRWAIEALRNGGDVASAVRNTVTNVDNLLLAEVERGPREARVAILAAEESLKDLEKAAAALRDSLSQPTGGLVNPDTRPLLEDLDRARAQTETKPEAARDLALDVLRRIGTQYEPIRQYRLAGPRFDSGWQAFRELHKRNQAGVADEPLERARLALVDGQALYRNADPAYAGRLDRALSSLSEARETILSEERRASSRAATQLLLGLLTLGLATSVLVSLYVRSAREGKKAEALLDSWETALDRKLEALLGELEPRVSQIVGPIAVEDRQGETLELAESVRTDVGALIILWTSARAVLEKAREHIRPRQRSARFANLFLRRHYRKGIALLRDEPVPFDPAEGLPRLFGAERGWREDLLGGLASYEPFRKSFQELTAELNTRAERATQGLDDLETAFTKLPELQEAIQERVRLVPVAQAALEEARRTMDDPVRSLRETRRATRALELFDRLPQVRSEIAAGENRIETARRELSAILGLDPESLLRETDQDPAERLARATRQADAARTALDLGDLDGTAAALEQATQLTLEAAALVNQTLEAGRSWEKDAGERRAETERLAGLIPEHQALATRMQERFGKSDGTLASGGLEAARGEIGVARHNLDAAAAAVREGRVLAAAALLQKVGAHQERAGLCLSEIKNELDRLIEAALAAERARRQREEEARRRRAAQVLLGSSSSARSSSSSSGSSSSGGGSSSSSSGSSGSGRSSWGSSRSGSGRSGW